MFDDGTVEYLTLAMERINDCDDDERNPTCKSDGIVLYNIILYYIVVGGEGSAYDIEWLNRVVPMPSYHLHQTASPYPVRVPSCMPGTLEFFFN